MSALASTSLSYVSTGIAQLCKSGATHLGDSSYDNVAQFWNIPGTTRTRSSEHLAPSQELPGATAVVTQGLLDSPSKFRKSYLERMARTVTSLSTRSTTPHMLARSWPSETTVPCPLKKLSSVSIGCPMLANVLSLEDAMGVSNVSRQRWNKFESSLLWITTGDMTDTLIKPQPPRTRRQLTNACVTAQPYAEISTDVIPKSWMIN